MIHSIYIKDFSMKKENKKLLFEMMEKVNPDFSQPKEELQELQNTVATQQQGTQPNVQYADNTYKMIAPALKQINTPEEFAGAFKGWFQYLGYSPQANNINIQRVRTDVEAIMKQMGYK
jgi:hypothetical protein